MSRAVENSTVFQGCGAGGMTAFPAGAGHGWRVCVSASDKNYLTERLFYGKNPLQIRHSLQGIIQYH